MEARQALAMARELEQDAGMSMRAFVKRLRYEVQPLHGRQLVYIRYTGEVRLSVMLDLHQLVCCRPPKRCCTNMLSLLPYNILTPSDSVGFT
jgi:hypothetical protein